MVEAQFRLGGLCESEHPVPLLQIMISVVQGCHIACPDCRFKSRNPTRTVDPSDHGQCAMHAACLFLRTRLCRILNSRAADLRIVEKPSKALHLGDL